MSLSSSAKKIFQPLPSRTHSRVESLIISTLEKSLKQSRHEIKMGIELEFFLMRKDGKIVDMKDSRNFMLEVSEMPGWKLYAEEGMIGQISKVSFEVPGIGYHSLKYEHPPHMLEIAFAPYSNLHQLYEAMVLVWEDFQKASSKLNIDLVFRSNIEAPNLNWPEITQFNSKYEALAATRASVVDESLRDEKWVHFTTYTAATQFHIGGTEWWKSDGKLVERLYRGELLAGLNVYELLGKAPGEVAGCFNSRWSGYLQVFRQLSLVGFPHFQDWTVKTWIENFCKSSLVFVDTDPFFGKNIDSIADVLSDGELMRAIQHVRDLQIVRPKLFGTLEFRADPALASPEKIIKQAALRFGIYHHCLNAELDPMPLVSFQELGERWRAGLNTQGLENSLENLREDAFRALQARGFGEEGLL